MIGLDTNVLVRYVAQDDDIESPKATSLIEGLSEANRGFISVIALVEMVWVIQGTYQATKEETIAIIERLLRVQTFVVENAEVVLKALHAYSTSSADFADCLIERSAHNANCTETMTFDSQTAKTSGMCLIQ